MAGTKRIRVLDELRGLCVLLMVVFHGFYTLGYLFDWAACRDLFWFFMPAEPVFAGLFIAICGFSCYLSHNNWKRGTILLFVSLAMSAFLWFVMPDNMIWFGILQFLACSILLFAACERPLSHLPVWLGVLLCVLLFVVTYHLPLDAGSYIGIEGLFTVTTPNLGVAFYPLGMGYVFGEDYFPLLPWVFLFLAGTFLGRWSRGHSLPAFCYRDHIRPLSFLGRHALLIYILHQPVIYGLAWIVRAII